MAPSRNRPLDGANKISLPITPFDLVWKLTRLDMQMSHNGRNGVWTVPDSPKSSQNRRGCVKQAAACKSRPEMKGTAFRSIFMRSWIIHWLLWPVQCKFPFFNWKPEPAPSAVTACGWWKLPLPIWTALATEWHRFCSIDACVRSASAYIH